MRTHTEWPAAEPIISVRIAVRFVVLKYEIRGKKDSVSKF